MSDQRTDPVLDISVDRRQFLQTLGAAGGAALLGSAGLPRKAQAAPKSLRYLNNETDPNTIAFLKQMVVDYKAAAGIDIQLETVPVLETWTKVTTAIKAGKPYDFITFGQITEPLLLAKDNLLIPLTSVIKEVGEKDFGPRALDWYRNELWMYPYDYNFNYLIYRKDWFEEKKLQLPTDWNGFLSLLEALNDPANKRYAITLPFSKGDQTSYTGRLVHTIEERSPELADKYGIMAYPAPEGGRNAVTFANDGFSIGKTENAEEALKFFRWFLKNDKLTDFQLTVPIHYQPPQFSTYKNERWRAHPLVQKHWAAMEVMLSFMNTDRTHVGSIQLEGPGPSPNQGKIWTSHVIPRMYQNVLTKAMTPSQAVDAAAKEIREFTEKG